MGHPSKIVFLNSDGTTAFEYKVPKGNSDMVRFNQREREKSRLASVWFCSVCVLRGFEVKYPNDEYTHPMTLRSGFEFFSHNSRCNNKHRPGDMHTVQHTASFCFIASV